MKKGRVPIGILPFQLNEMVLLYEMLFAIYDIKTLW